MEALGIGAVPGVATVEALNLAVSLYGAATANLADRIMGFGWALGGGAWIWMYRAH